MASSPIDTDAAVLDCSGKVIAPGFIDAHSHMDLVLALADHAARLSSFAAQGCTTFVGGNCGFGTSGFLKDSPFQDQLSSALLPELKVSWNTLSQYQARLRKQGMSHNLSVLAGHGTTRVSICGMKAAPLEEKELSTLLGLLEEALDQGAAGISLGLQYAPGIFAPMEEIDAVARLAQSKDKVLAVHGRAYSCLSGDYPLDPSGLPHNILALEEMIGVARRTGVRLEYSHLILWAVRRIIRGIRRWR